MSKVIKTWPLSRKKYAWCIEIWLSIDKKYPFWRVISYCLPISKFLHENVESMFTHSIHHTEVLLVPVDLKINNFS